MKSQKHRAHNIANERIEQLFALVKQEYHSHSKDARRYVEMIRNLATKHNLRITDIKRQVCKECNSLLVPGKTCTVRIHNDRRIITCAHCQKIKRLGLRSKIASNNDQVK